MVTVWDVRCCKLLHMKRHQQHFMLLCHLQDFMLMGHLPYSVHKFSIHSEYEHDMSISVPTQSRPSSASRFNRQDRMFCFVRKDGIYARAIHLLVFSININSMSKCYQRVYQCFDVSFSYLIQRLILCYVMFTTVT